MSGEITAGPHTEIPSENLVCDPLRGSRPRTSKDLADVSGLCEGPDDSETKQKDNFRRDSLGWWSWGEKTWCML